MAMTVASLKARIIAALGTAEDTTKQANFAQAIATAVIAEIQANAQVTAGIPVSTTGTAAAQSGATTAPGVIT